MSDEDAASTRDFKDIEELYWDRMRLRMSLLVY